MFAADGISVLRTPARCPVTEKAAAANALEDRDRPR